MYQSSEVDDSLTGEYHHMIDPVIDLHGAIHKVCWTLVSNINQYLFYNFTGLHPHPQLTEVDPLYVIYIYDFTIQYSTVTVGYSYQIPL